MNIRKIQFSNFTSHDASCVNLPATGLVVVTGENGAGKSSIVEAVSWGCWGKTLRGTAPWRGEAKPACIASLVTDACEVRRTRAGAKTELDWSVADLDGAFPTATKAQEPLTQLLGPFDLWRRSHVFSSADASHFTLASDAERKRLIETFLGFDRFDPALAACREDLKKAEGKAADLEVTMKVAVAKLESARTRLTETKKQLALTDIPVVKKAKKGKSPEDIKKLVTSTQKEIDALRAKLRSADRESASFEAEAKAAKALLDKLRVDTCPTCQQQITPALRQRLHVKAKRAQEQADVAREEATTGTISISDALNELEEELGHLRELVAARTKELLLEEQSEREAERAKKARAQLEQTMRTAANDVNELNDQLAKMEEQLGIAVTDVAELSAVEQVLGTKGVRAHILGRSLSGIEAVTNTYLAKLHAKGMQVKLRPYVELKSGGVQDSISLEVIGVGGELGYKASSGGERRRLDLALLLALAEVSAAARGTTRGTLFFDECMDALDEDGVEAAVEVLTELAKDRACVVITHNQQLASRLPAVQRLHVANGQISV